jgi:sugar lactone lactonase YvrE
MSRPRTLLTGLVCGESPRWHDDRLWFAHWGTHEVVAVDLEGRSEAVAQVPATVAVSLDWLPDGRMLVVSGPDGLLLRQEPDGTLVTHADLNGFGPTFNEVVVDGRGNAYVDSASFEPGVLGTVVLVTTDGVPRLVADQIAFGNGMALTPDGATLIVAESHGNRLTAFDVAADGSLSGRRVWAALDGGFPDGICLDAEGAAWYADVPNRRCVRVREGGEVLDTVEVDRGCFACMLGGPDGRTLFVLAAEWGGPESLDGDARTGQVLVARAPAPAAGRP